MFINMVKDQAWKQDIPPQKAKYPIQALEKAMAVIDAMHKGGASIGISEIDTVTGIGKSTVHRILDTLMAYGYVEKEENSSKYRLSWKFFEIGHNVLAQRNLQNMNIAALRELCEKHEESVNLGVIATDNTMVIVNRMVPQINLVANLRLGSRLPLHASAMGKVYLCTMELSRLRELFPNGQLESYTPNTVTSFDALLEQLKKVREQGYSIDDQEVYPGITCIAMPIKNHQNVTIAAVSVSGPSSRLHVSKILSIKDDLAKACNEASNYLGNTTCIPSE